MQPDFNTMQTWHRFSFVMFHIPSHEIKRNGSIILPMITFQSNQMSISQINPDILYRNCLYEMQRSILDCQCIFAFNQKPKRVHFMQFWTQILGVSRAFLQLVERMVQIEPLDFFLFIFFILIFAFYFTWTTPKVIQMVAPRLEIVWKYDILWIGYISYP